MTETEGTSSGQEQYAGGYSHSDEYVDVGTQINIKRSTTTEENQPLITETTASVVLLPPEQDELALREEQCRHIVAGGLWMHTRSLSD